MAIDTSIIIIYFEYMNNHQENKLLRERAIEEIKRFFYYTVSLTILFSIFNFYQRVLLNDFSNSTIPYGFSFIQALILAKIIMVADVAKSGERFSRQPLIFPVIYKTITFCFLLLIFTVIEHLILGIYQGKTVVMIFQEFMTKHLHVALARMVIMFYVFLLFFSVLETSRILGENKLFNLFFKNRKHNL